MERTSEDRAAVGPVPRIRRVLAATDLSQTGDAAVPHAYALLRGGGMVHILHVIEVTSLPNPLYAHYAPGRAPDPAERAAQERVLGESLGALVPSDASSLGIETAIELVEGRDVPSAICEAAERLDADVVCLGSHGRSALMEKLLGSVTESVLRRVRRPVLIVRASQG